ncbi:hypothetical protein Poli38472_003460 [Pythium oligandrum]|uniref:Elicitin n=1 Tax=Pythium oligandrum TaxID=41045 RepID=A0A8K1C6V2_PYTOL|nr:hypothetical protein Poli38472_003460 [Pythium oligandrum]|eukprot:TMW57535.1 hypothetical protein Poli38472_003460 [Pythium oligandrum]
MKFAAALSSAFLAVASAYDEVTECQSLDYLALVPLASDDNLLTCQDATNWQLLPPVGYPSRDQLDLLCQTPECFGLIDSVKALNVSDCLLNFDGVKINFKKLAEEFEPHCFNSTSPGYATNGTTGSNTTVISYSNHGVNVTIVANATLEANVTAVANVTRF